ncbi:cupin domain-containing protein (plasmid) [Rhizobium grahamii]|uniref:Cupin domain-containing protein n=1 Tax=Rhizobium grahamii TaxID=1120045 RepID=A0A5Q0CH04_9HYPH|nr:MULTISPECIES: oxalate decarboxylase family bicupin [Rhizobium]QFY63630.1 cupin domain-containing protein [Rhizobium grahamii]QRM51604.1 cupin domain-containing protein [Rhizobium sp. BG6]
MNKHETIQPIRGTRGADDPGPRNIELDLQNPDILIPPETDNGSLPNLRFPFAMAHNRLEDGGWAREVTVREFPVAKSMAGVNMRLGPGVVRELHWHKEAEWAYILQGTARLTIVDPEGNLSIDDLKPGDVWLVPAGVPHSIQGLEEGTEFLLVFDDGNFSENETLLITEYMAHTPPSVLAKNFGVASENFADIPKSEKYIFRLPVPAPLDAVRGLLPNSPPPLSYVFHSSEIPAARYTGGSVKTIDAHNFPVTTLSALIIEIEPGGMREMHWHPDADEWQYYIEGEARMTVFDATSKARTFNYRAGDVGFVPRTLGHYIENTGTTPVKVVNVFNSRLCTDVSLNRWMALTPPDLVQGHLNLNETVMKALRQTREAVVR